MLFRPPSLFLIALIFLCPSLGYSAETIPRPEHPNPQMERSEWLNLNGSWEFAETDEDEDTRFLSDAPYPDHIIVPFCRESSLSGLGRLGFVKNVWYRRSLSLPKDWRSKRFLLHVGASDWRTRVWMNGSLLGQHKGGSSPFALEITRLLKDDGNVVVIHAFDDTQSGLQALGKQASSEKSQGCVYTRTTGIWQTVWIEGVGDSFIRRFAVTPEPQKDRIQLHAELDGDCEGIEIRAEAFANGKSVGVVESPAHSRISMDLDLSKRLMWSVDDPFLYDLKLTLIRKGKKIDEVKSYFGLREIAIKGAAILINEKPVFQRLILDQGFYPDGIWTAPTDEALKNDILLSKAVGFNGARLHQKVFEPRYLYWADRLGYLVWGEFPNWGLNYTNPEVNLPVIDEWVEILQRDRNHPSIVGWCPFNETPSTASPLQQTIVRMTRAIDPSRPVIETSGWTHGISDPEVLDAHDYNQNPDSFRRNWMIGQTLDLPERYGKPSLGVVPFMISEFGGTAWTSGKEGWGYGKPPANVDEFYSRYEGLVNALLDNRLMFGFCYTQLTDVEQEQNGLYTYDRKPKFDVERISKITRRKAIYESDPPLESSSIKTEWKLLVGAALDKEAAQPWRYTVDKPQKEWMNPRFDDSSWSKGLGGFGKKAGWESKTGTRWDTEDLWLRSGFVYEGKMNKAALVIHYDNGTEIYLNGKEIWRAKGWNDCYTGFDLMNELRKHLKKGDNTIAIHCHQDTGGQFIDTALLVGE